MWKPRNKDAHSLHNCFSVFVVLLFNWPLLLLFQKALCKVKGGPSWCLTNLIPVLLLGFTGRVDLKSPAELQDLCLESVCTYQKAPATWIYLTWSYRFVITWIFLEGVNFAGMSSSTRVIPKTNKWMGKTVIVITNKYVKLTLYVCEENGVTKIEDVIDILALFLTFSFPVKLFWYLDCPLACISAPRLQNCMAWIKPTKLKRQR